MRAKRMRSQSEYRGIATAAASISTPATVNNSFNASIFRLLLGSCAPRDSWFPAMEPSAAGPVLQTSTPRTEALQPPATEPLPDHSLLQSADSWLASVTASLQRPRQQSEPLPDSCSLCCWPRRPAQER